METEEEEKVELPQDYVGRNTRASQRVSIKLHEVGPRVSLSLLKVEEGLCSGATLYHSLVIKSEGEAADTALRVAARAALQEKRKLKQIKNVERKRKATEEKAAARKRRRGAQREDGEEEENNDDDAYGNSADVVNYDDNEYDDAEWYRREVGEEPAAELGLAAKSTRGRKAPAPKQSENERAPSVYAKAVVGLKGRQ